MLHSGLGEGERADAWRRIRAGAVDVVVGTRLAVLAPLAGGRARDRRRGARRDLQERPDARAIQARDLAVTPRPARRRGRDPRAARHRRSRRSDWRAAGAYRRFTLPERAAGRAPDVELVDLREELAAGNRGLLSGAAGVAPRRALDPAAGDRAILVINRRGAASAVLCRDCGHVQACPECTRPLVYHQAGMTLRCHHCGAAAPMVVALPGLLLAPDPVPRRRDGAPRERGPGALPRASRRPPRPRRGRAPRCGGAASSTRSRRAGSTSSSGPAS